MILHVRELFNKFVQAARKIILFILHNVLKTVLIAQRSSQKKNAMQILFNKGAKTKTYLSVIVVDVLLSIIGFMVDVILLPYTYILLLIYNVYLVIFFCY